MKNQDILISILVACYNGEKYIDSCLKSCVNQTYKNIEIIVINDGSTDNSKFLLEQWANKDKRIKCFNQKNIGLGATRNSLIEKSKGYYFSFVDIDDTIPHNAIELLVEHSVNGKRDIVVGRSKLVINQNNNKKIVLPFIPSWRYTHNMTNGHYIKSNICTPWASIIKKEYFNSLNISFLKGKVFEDIGVMTYLFLNTKEFTFIKNVVYEYHKYKLNPDDSEKKLSAFNNLCYKKIDDIYLQSKQLFKYINNNKLFLTKQYKRYVNGVFFQILPANIFLTQNLTKDKYIRYVLRYNLTYYIYKMGREIKYSKTFWKSAAYFFLYMKSMDVLIDIKNNKFNRKFITGTYLNNGNYKYSIIDYNNLDNKKINKIYDIIQVNDYDLDRINDNLIRNCKLAIKINQINKEAIRKLFLNIYKFNIIPFITIESTYDVDFIIWLSKYVVGVNIICNDNNNLNEVENKIITRLNNTEQKKIIYLTCNSNFNVNKNMGNIDGVFWK